MVWRLALLNTVDHLGDLGDGDVMKDMAATSGEFPVVAGKGIDARLRSLVDHVGMIVKLS